MKKVIFLLFACLSIAAASNAQVANYTFAASSGTYTPISGTVAHASGWDDAIATAIPIGFSFVYNGVAYTTCTINTNGYITFGATTPSTTLYTPISDATAYAGCVAGWARDLQAQATAPLGLVQYTSSGGVFTVQWSDTRRYNGSTANAERFEMQIKLYQTTNVIQVVYGNWSNAVSATTTNNGQVGLRGTTSADFKNLAIASGGNWAAPAAGTLNTDICFYNESSTTTKPASGQTYTFTPPPLCVAPTAQPTALNLTPSSSAVAGSFTAAAGAPSNYLVVRTSTPVPPANPVDGTSYAPGSSALGGVIVSNGITTSFNATSLAPLTQYYFWVYSFNAAACMGGPVYLTTSPLSGNTTTLNCSGPSGVIPIGPTGTYPTLTAALAVLNGGVSGSVILELQAAYTSAGETFPIVFPANTCLSPAQTITIRPETGATGLSITSANTTATVDFNGCAYITFDGRPGGAGAVSQLTVANTATAGVAMRFINDANNNTVKYCTVAGVTTSTTSGVILFSTTSGVNGNDNNTVDNCNVTSGGTTATNAIYSSGTTTTTATNNSNNTISNNNIFNYFAAGSASAGVKLEGGTTDWTISNNKFYQTATRTHTSGVQHSAIWLNNSTSGNNFQVLGNTIGYASNTGTGTYTLVTLSGTTFIPIFASVGTTTASSIQGNTITAIAMSGASSGTSSSAPFRGIYVSSGLANVGATSAGTSGTGNTIGSQSATGAITYTTTSASASDVMGMFNFGSSAWVVMNNNIGGITASNSSTGAANAFGIRFNTSSTVNTTIQNNTIGGTVANSIQSTTTATGSQVVGLYISTSNTTVTGNTIRNLSAAGGTGTTTGASVIGINFISTSVNHTISGNTIFNLSNSNAAAATVVTGIQYTASTGANMVERNFIYGLTSATTSATAEINGIRVASGTTTYRNNMIAVGAGVNNAVIVSGVNEVGGIDNFWHNSIYVGGSPTAGTANSFAFNSTVTTNVRSFRDNIFMNARSNSGATGKNYAVQVGGTAANPAGLTINNNIYYITGTGTVFGRFNALDVADLSAWKTAVGQDGSSGQANPQYNNPTAATPDLHLHPSNPTPAEGNGFDLGVTNDFDNEVRASLTPVDIGADAGNYVTLDLFPPTIAYTPLSGTLCATNPTLSATIIDVSGINVAAGTKPRIYYKKSTNANALGATNDNTTDGWKYTEATNASSPFSFTIDYALVNGGVPAGSTIQYFVVAQDLAGTPNVAINSGSPATALTSVNLVAGNFPIGGTINSYAIGSGGLSGTVTIGAAGTYTSLTGAGGLFAAINAGGLTDNLTANIIDASVTETGATALNGILYGCAGPYTLTIKPNAGLAATLTGTNANALIKLNGADNVIFDGLNTGGASLTITNTNAAGLTVMWIASASTTDGANNNTIKNCTISGISNTGSVGCIIAGSGATLGNAADAPNSNNTIQGNTLTTAQNGIYISGNLASLDQNWVITGNTMGSAVAANKLGFRGVSVQGVNNFTISNNTIQGVVTATTATSTGITTFVTATNGNIFGNKISDIKNTNTSGFGANGLSLQGTSTTSNINVYNNFISDVAGFGFNGTGVADNGYGMIITGGGGYNIYYNTVVMNTNQTAATGLPAALNVTSGVATANSLNIRNNIFVNTQTVGTDRYCVFSGAASSVYADINYNDYYFTGPNLGNIGGTQRANLAAWQAGTTKDANSKSAQPVFVSATDLHLSNAAGANWCLNGTGVNIPGITADIDGDIRNNPPDIGADEFTAVGAGDIATPASQTVCSGTAITTIVLSGGASSYSWTRDNTGSVTGIAGSGTGNISGTLTNTTTAPITVTFTITALNAAGCAGPATFTATVLVNPTPTAVATPSSQTICSATAITTIVLSGAVSGTTYNWTRDNTVAVTGIAASGSGNISGTLTNTTAAPVTVTFTITPTANGCPGTPITATVLVNPTPNAAATPSSQTICSGNAITTIVLSGATSGTTYNWTRDNTVAVTGIAASGSGDISGSLTNTTNAPVTVTFTITPTANGCPGTPITATVLVNPTPNATATPASQISCSGAAITTIVLSSTTAGTTTYSWTRNNTVAVTGIAASGSGNISGTLTNTTNASVTVTFTITPSNSGCPGLPITATVTVDPTPDVTQPANQTVCNNSATAPVNFTGSVAGTVFNWTNNTPSIGLAASGTGNIASFTATNATNAPVTATVTVTPTYTSALSSQTFNYTGAVQTFTVPAGVTSLNITCFGAQGENATIGGTGGKGASATGTLSVTPGQVLNIYVGGAGVSGTGGFNGGGNGGAMGNTFFGGTTPGNGPAGGGASDVRVGGTALVNRVIVAGGGGGAGANGDWPGCQPAGPAGNGGDGGLIGADGTFGLGVNACNCGDGGGDKGTGGTNLAGGNAGGYRGSTNCLRANWTIGANGASGAGGSGSTAYFNGTGAGGGGGGGFFGGGSGGSGSDTSPGGGGGGGSSYTGGVTAGVVTAGVRSGDGMVVISFTGGTPCPGTPKTFTYTVNPTATVNAVANQAVCSGATTAPVNFSSPTTGGTIVYNWTNNQPSIGLAASGTGDIAAFTATNATGSPIVATITVTPSYTNGVTCVGTPRTFTITVNPLPSLSGTVTQPSTCVAADGAINLNIASPAGPYTFAWTGAGVNPTSQNQSGLTIGLYGVTVTVNATSCAASTSFTLIGPGGCSICPTIPSVTTTPGIGCSGQTLGVTASGLTNMGISYGIIFKYSTTPLADPYTGGTTIATVPNGSLTGGGTIANASTSFAAAGNYFVYAILTPTPLDPGCRPFGLKNLLVEQTPVLSPVSNVAYCNGITTVPVIFGGTITPATISWTNSNPAIGLPASGTGNIPGFTATNTGTAPITATITATPASTNCTGAPITFTITVNPTATVNAVANQTLCNGAATAAVNFSSPTTGGSISYSWTNNASSIGLPSSGIGNIASFTAVNTGSVPVVATITVTPNYTNAGITCAGTPRTFTITVNPTPTVNAVANQVLCNGTATAAVTFSGAVAGTVYNWTNSAPSIGLAASGTGNIASFIATNTGNAPVVATITVTPSANGCTGTPRTFTITVNPTAVMNTPANLTVCNGAATGAINFTTANTGGTTTYSWTNNNTSIGLGSAGIGNIASFIAVNPTNNPVTATITVTPTFTNGGVSCTGAPITFTITVNPTPVVNPPLPGNQILCNGSATTAVTFTSSQPGVFFQWTNNQPSIGLAGAGVGNIPSFIATNTGTAPVTATITVTPVAATGCAGPPVTFTITVNPTPSVNAIANQTVCSGATTTAVTISGPVPGTVYSWTNNNASIGLAASGTGNIGAFTAVNTTSAPVTATITVTPNFTSGGISCSGAPVSFTITVNPTANVAAVGDKVLCNGTATGAINFTGTVAGTTYSWTNSNTAIGLAASGSGNIASFTATNATSAPITATITVTPSAAGCTGVPMSFTITVNPTATVNAIANQTVCNGSATAAVTPTSPVAGVIFNWTIDNPSIGVGLVPSGTGTFPSFTAINTTPSPITATVTYTATLISGGTTCVGPTRTFTITVNPNPNVTFTNVPPRVCLSDTVVTLTASPVGGTWSGRGVVGNTFNAKLAGTGVATVTYTYTNGSGCTAVVNQNITVNDCIERHNVFATAIRIYPNPSSGRFNIRFLSDVYKEFNVEIIAADGKVLREYHFGGLLYGSVIPMNERSLPGGTYLLRVYNTQESASFKFVIQH